MSTGSITSTGLGSGLDIESLVTKLMTVEQQPITLLQTQESSYKTKLSSWGQVSASMSSFQIAAQALNTRAKFGAFSSSIADSTIASASVSSASVAGTYSLEVTQLADVQKVKTAGYATMSTAVTADTLPTTLALEIGTTTSGVFTADGTKTANITIDSSNNTLAGVRDAINNAKAGVTASVVNDGGTTPYHLVLTSDSTGTSNSFKLSGLSDFTYDPGTGTGQNITKIQDAADAKLTVDGISITKPTNVITDAVQGTTLTLSKTNTGSPTKLTISQDNSSITQKVSAFVDAYNALNSVIKVQTAYNNTTGTSGTLNGDSTARGIITQLRAVLTGSMGSGTSAKRLSDIGVAFQKDGSLALDSSKFQTALSDTTKDVAGMFATDGTSVGFASQIGSRIAGMLGTGGLLTARTDGINKTIKNTDTRIATLTTGLAAIEKRYRAQYNAMDTTIAGLNATGTYLTQQLSAITNMTTSLK